MAVSQFVWVAVVFSATGVFLFGYNVGSINGVQDMKGFRAVLGFDIAVEREDGSILPDDIMLNSTADFVPEGLPQCSRDEDTSELIGFSQLLGLLVAIVNIGGLFGSFLAGKLADFAGRKLTIMIGGSLTALGGTLLCTAMNAWMIIVGRFVAGIGFGLLYMVIPVYIAEISPQRSRGKLSSTIGPMFAGGLLVGFAVNLGCVEFEIGWRISLGLQSVFGVLFVFGMSFLPRTPRWLLMTKKDDEAEEIISKLHPTSKCDNRVMLSFLELKQSIQCATQNYNWKTQFRDLLMWETSQRVLMGVIISALSPICGNFLLYYSVTLFCKLHILPYISTVLMGVLNLGASLATVLLVDKVGRKTLLIMGSLCMCLTLLASVILIFIFRVEEEKNLAVGYSIVALLCFFVLCFSATWLTVPWIINSEIFPICVRGIAVSLTSGALWLAAFILIQLFPILLASPLRTPGTLSVIAAITMFSFIFTFLFLPETKGVGLEDVDKLFTRSWSQRMMLSDLLPCQRYSKRLNPMDEQNVSHQGTSV